MLSESKWITTTFLPDMLPASFDQSDRSIYLRRSFSVDEKPISVRSILSNFVGIPTDCPHREQNGWTGDALFSCDQTLMKPDI